MNGEEEDRVIWKGDNKGIFFFFFDNCGCPRQFACTSTNPMGNKGKFSIRALYSILKSDCVISFPLGIIWNSLIPSNLSFFTQEAYWHK